MGEVWQATDEVLGRAVAVKAVLPALLGEEGFIRRFVAEARAMASVRHPGVVAIHDFHSDTTGAFLIMEYIESEALSRTLGRLGRLTPAITMNLVGQAADALQAAHDKGIVHRDVKPGNLLIRADGTLMLTDFGIARSQDGTALTTTGAVLGTLSYLAPEQVIGQPATPRSDVYALGLVAYECLAGRRPFEGENPFVVAMQRVREAPPKLAGDVPQPVAAVVERALATDPAHRWPSAAEFAAAARRAALDLLSNGNAGTINAAPAAATPNLAQTLVDHQGWPAAQHPPAAVPASRSTPPGFVRHGSLLYPLAPMCWGGLTIPGGVGRVPRRIDPAEPHYWETFAAGYLPDDAIYLRQDDLMNRADIAAVCSEAVLADRSRDPSRMRGWEREPWPVQIDRDTWIFHCLASPGDGEWVGSAFRSGV
jgi:serine/threonine-protein kinase